MTRSPVNSTNFRLRVGQGGRGVSQAAVQLDAAGQVDDTVDSPSAGPICSTMALSIQSQFVVSSVPSAIAGEKEKEDG